MTLFSFDGQRFDSSGHQHIAAQTTPLPPAAFRTDPGRSTLGKLFSRYYNIPDPVPHNAFSHNPPSPGTSFRTPVRTEQPWAQPTISTSSTPASLRIVQPYLQNESDHADLVKQPTRLPSGMSNQSANRPRRPPNAWILYRSDKMKTLKRTEPSAPRRDSSKLIAEMWKDETEDVKRYYWTLADLAKAEYHAHYPTYHVQAGCLVCRKRKVKCDGKCGRYGLRSAPRFNPVQAPSSPAPHDGHQTRDATKHQLGASVAEDAWRPAVLEGYKDNQIRIWGYRGISGHCAESSGDQYVAATVEERRNACGREKDRLGDLLPINWLRIQSNHPSDDIQGSASKMTSKDHHGRFSPPIVLPLVSQIPRDHVLPHPEVRKVPYGPLTTPRETPVNQFRDPIDIPPHSSRDSYFFQHAPATPQHNTFPWEYAPLHSDHHYTAILDNSPTESTLSSVSANSALPLFGPTEGVSAFKPASPGSSNWLYDATIPYTSHQGGSYSTDPILDYLNIPFAGMVPQAPTPALIGDMASDLRPGSLADSRRLFAAESSVSVELRTYQNRPVAPVEILGISIIKQRREVAAWLTLDLSSVPTHNAKPWSAVRISRTPSVRIHKDVPMSVSVLDVDVVVAGAESHRKYTEACRNCKERRGAGPIIDFRSKADVVKVKKGLVRLHFVFCCYPADRDEEKYYRVEVVLSERPADGQRCVITRKQLPYHFDVYSRHMTEQAT